MGDGDLENIVLGIVQRYMAGHHSERHGLVTSYDPDKHLAKVMFQPEQQESGWLPIETGHIGNGYGIAVGLQPGDGKTTGDQVIARYQEGDFDSGKIVQRVHSDDQKAPKVQSGELVIWTRFQKSNGGSESASGAQGGTGQQIYLKNDGSATVTDGNGATIILDGNGNISIACKNLKIDASGVITVISQSDIGIKATGNVEIKGAITGIDGTKMVIVQGAGDVSDGSITPAKPQPTIPSFSVPS